MTFYNNSIYKDKIENKNIENDNLQENITGTDILMFLEKELGYTTTIDIAKDIKSRDKLQIGEMYVPNIDYPEFNNKILNIYELNVTSNNIEDEENSTTDTQKGVPKIKNTKFTEFFMIVKEHTYNLRDQDEILKRIYEKIRENNVAACKPKFLNAYINSNDILRQYYLKNIDKEEILKKYDMSEKMLGTILHGKISDEIYEWKKVIHLNILRDYYNLEKMNWNVIQKKIDIEKGETILVDVETGTEYRVTIHSYEIFKKYMSARLRTLEQNLEPSGTLRRFKLKKLAELNLD